MFGNRKMEDEGGRSWEEAFSTRERMDDGE